MGMAGAGNPSNRSFGAILRVYAIILQAKVISENPLLNIIVAVEWFNAKVQHFIRE
jgi:hypothetical protein